MFSWNSNKKSMHPLNLYLTGMKENSFLGKKIKLVGLDTGVFDE